MAHGQSGAVDVDASGAYQQSFGFTPSGVTYSDPMGFKSFGMNSDLKKADHWLTKAATEGAKMAVQMKAQTVTSGGAGTAGYAMIPVYVDPRLIDTTRKFLPLVSMIPRVTNMGVTADYNKITAKGGGFSAAEDAALNERNNTYVRASTAIKYLYAVGRVTLQSVAAQPSYIIQGMQPQGGASQVSPWADQAAANSLQQEILVQTLALKEYEENTIINGNSGTTATDFDGIVTLMSTTNNVAKSTTALSLDDITAAIQKAYDAGGLPRVAVCSSSVFTDLLNLLSAKIGFLQSTQTSEWGFTFIKLNTMVGDVTVIPSMYLSNVSGSKAIYFLDMSVIEMRVLQDVTYQELAQTNDSRKFYVKEYVALVIKNTSFCASITGIA